MLLDVEDDSDLSDISAPEDLLNNDPIDIYNMVNYPDITQSSMFPCGIPAFLDESLPFNPASLHITSDMCTANYLNTVELEILDANVNLNRLIQRRHIYSRQQKILISVFLSVCLSVVLSFVLNVSLLVCLIFLSV
jgi:hypothetical protein